MEALLLTFARTLAFSQDAESNCDAVNGKVKTILEMVDAVSQLQTEKEAVFQASPRTPILESQETREKAKPVEVIPISECNRSLIDKHGTN